MICRHPKKQAVATRCNYSYAHQLVTVICLDCGKTIHCKLYRMGNNQELKEIRDLKKEGMQE